MFRFLLPVTMLVLLGGCAPVADGEVLNENCAGVEVRVNFGPLDQAPIAECIEVTDGTILAKEALNQAGVEIAGTTTYPDAIVCRVNGLPSEDVAIKVEGEDPHFESCLDMPPAFAYWALWVVNDPEVGWEYAMEGAATLELTAGQSIGLAFATGDQAPTPDS